MTEGVTAKALADLFELEDPRRIQQLAEQGYVVRIKRGRYALTESVRGYIRFWRERAEGRHATNAVDEARLRREELAIRKAELELAALEGGLLELDHHTEIVSRLADAFRAAILSIPGVWGPRVVGIRAPAEGTEVLRRCAQEALEDMLRVATELEAVDWTPLPEDFPGYAHLIGAGVDTLEAVRAYGDVTSIDGIGPKTAAKIAAALVA